MIALLIVAGLVAAGLIIGFVATAKAPMGFQDETGFHYGPDTERAEEFQVTVAEPKAA